MKVVVIATVLMVAAIGLITGMSVQGAGSGFEKDTNLKDAQVCFLGEDGYDNSGHCVSDAGDVNGDGYNDIIIGAPYNDDGGENAGKIYLIFGNAFSSSSRIHLSNVDASFVGEFSEQRAGSSVSGAGDVNGDGYYDIIIGASGNYYGRTYLILGRPSGWTTNISLSNSDASFVGEKSEDYFGRSISGTGDVNGDGYGDFIIGAPGYNYNNGITYLIFGRSTGWTKDTDISMANASYLSWESHTRSGSSVSGAGDVNGDGYYDFLIGAPTFEKNKNIVGQTYLILGKNYGWKMNTRLYNVDASFIGENAGDESGCSVSNAGDVNRDGYDDILIGARGAEEGISNSGKSYLIFGKEIGWKMNVSLSNSNASFIGEKTYDFSGSSISNAGDTNGDGFDDILIGAPNNYENGDSAGKTYLILGKKNGWTNNFSLSNSDASFVGENPGDLSGWSISGCGDVNADSYEDIIIGSPGNNERGPSVGKTYLLLVERKPPAPINVSVKLHQNSLVLSWNIKPFWKDLRRFDIYRSTDGVTFDHLASLGNRTYNYSDYKITLGTRYYYKITSGIHALINSEYSATVNILFELDFDNDSIGDSIDTDDDNDGIFDDQDRFPYDPSEWLDTDDDGIGNNADTDDDNDGIPDITDETPLNPVNGLLLEINSLKEQINNLNAELEALKTNTSSSLANLTSELIKLNLDLSTEISILNETLNNIEPMNLTYLDNALNSILFKLLNAGYNDTVLFNQTSELQASLLLLKNETLKNQNALNLILSRLDALENRPDNETEDEEKEDSNIVTIFIIITIILIICLLLLLIYIYNIKTRLNKISDEEM